MPKARLELEIDLDIWKTLKAVAEPLIDTPEMVMRRLLGIEKREDRSRHLAAKAFLADRADQMSSKKDYYPYILRVLEALGGKGKTHDIVEKVGELMLAEGRLTELDQEPIPSGREVRWRNMLRWAHSDLVENGWLRESSPRGLWELSGEGRDVLRGMEG